MYLLLSMSLIIFIISLAVMMIASVLSKKSILDREKCSPFECGFDPKSVSRIPFSLRFFLIAIIFLIFDVEIALLLPVVLLIKISNVLFWGVTVMLFIFILLGGLYHEWNQGVLVWTY